MITGNSCIGRILLQKISLFFLLFSSGKTLQSSFDIMAFTCYKIALDPAHTIILREAF